MALSKKRRPVALITGRVIAIEPKAAYDRDGKQTGEVGRFDVTIFQASHATPDVRFVVGRDAVTVPVEGQEVALIVDCGETDEYGANFRAVRYATEDDLEAIAQKLPALAGK